MAIKRIIGDELAGGSNQQQPSPFRMFGQLQGPFGFTAPERTQTEFFQPGGGIDAFLGSIGDIHAGTGGGGAAAKSNFNLNKSVRLKDLALQRQELERQKGAGLRDIEQGRVEGLRAAVNNALQRGVFRSGITTENKGRVEREAGEAAGDLSGRIKIALDRIANQRRGAAGQKFSSGGGGGGGGLSAGDIKEIFDRISGLVG